MKIINRNFTIDNVYSTYDGPLIKTYNPEENGANVTCEIFNVTNIIQDNSSYAPAILTTNHGKIKFDT